MITNQDIIKKLVSQYVDSHNDYMIEEHSKITSKNLDKQEGTIFSLLLTDLGYKYIDGLYIKE